MTTVALSLSSSGTSGFARSCPGLAAFALAAGQWLIVQALFFLSLFVLTPIHSPAYAAAPLCLSGATKVLLPQPQGSQTDALYAVLQAHWAGYTGASLAFENRPGRGGSYAAAGLLDAKDSACTLAAIQLPSFFLLASSADSMFTPGDVDPVAVFASLPLALWVAEDGPCTAMADVIAHMRAVIEQGDDVAAVAGAGSYTDQHLAFLQFERAAGVKGRYLPVLGSAEAAVAVQTGNAVACLAYAMPNQSMPGMRALAVAGAKRSPALPDVPTMRELAIDMESLTVFGLAVSASLPEEKRSAYAAALAGLSGNADIVRSLAVLGAEAVSVPPLELAATLAAWAEQARNAVDDYTLIPRNRRR